MLTMSSQDEFKRKGQRKRLLWPFFWWMYDHYFKMAAWMFRLDEDFLLLRILQKARVSSDETSYCIPDAKRGYYGFIIVVVRALVRRDFLLATYSPHFFPDFFHIWQVA